MQDACLFPDQLIVHSPAVVIAMPVPDPLQTSRLPAPIDRIITPFRPANFSYPRFALTLLIGTISGYLFFWLGVPLPWMLGPMCACTIAVLFNAPVDAPPVIRKPMIAIVGVMLGSNFSPALLMQAPQWWQTLLIMGLFLIVCGIIGPAYYRIVGKMDRPSAFYAGMPGGLFEMTLAGEETGGDGRLISLIHSARILLIVSTVPFIVQYVEGVHLGPRQATALSILDTPGQTFFWIVGVAIAGSQLAKRVGLPASFLFGPMLLSAIVHGTGLTNFVLPRELVAFAQILIGCATGCRFLGWSKREIFRIIGLSFGANALVLVATVLFALAGHEITGIKLSSLLLALAPAGIAEMSLIAIALHIEVAFILVHQIIRISLVSLLARSVFRLIGWQEKPPEA